MHHRLKFLRPVFWVLALFWLTAAGARAETALSPGLTAVYVIGSSAFIADNPAASRDAAIQNGLAAAVFQAMVGLSSPEAVTAGFQTLNQTYFSRPERYIQEYKVIAEARAQNIHRLLLEVMVHGDRLKSIGSRNAPVMSDVAVVVEGTSGNIASFVKLRGRLGDTPGVSSVQVLEMAADSAHLVVTYRGTADALAEVLQSFAFETFAIEMLEATESAIRLRLSPR